MIPGHLSRDCPNDNRSAERRKIRTVEKNNEEGERLEALLSKWEKEEAKKQ